MVSGMVNAQVHNLQNSKAQNDAEARKKIQMIANRLDSGDDFATLAMNYSEDPETSNNGGDLGMAPESAFKSADPGTRDAVMKLKPGQYTPVIPVMNPANHQPYAYMIVKLIAKEPAGQRDLNDPRVQQAIRQQLRDRREQLLKAAYYESSARRRQSHELLRGRSAEECRGGEVNRMLARTLRWRVTVSFHLPSVPSRMTRRVLSPLLPSSFFVKTSFTSCGFAWPFEAFITCPTKNPSIVFLPARYCSTCLGFAAINSSASFSSAEVSRDCSGRPSSS